MPIKITEKALREYVRSMLSEQNEEENSPRVAEVPLENPEVPVAVDARVGGSDLGPPVADPAYVPESVDELKSAVGKLLDDVPEHAVPTAYKVVKKTLDNLFSVLRQRAEIMPLSTLKEHSNVERLLLLISEQYGGSYQMSDPTMRSEEPSGDTPGAGVRSATYSDDRKVSPPASKPAEVQDDRSQFDRFFKKKMEDMLALAKARYPKELAGISDWNEVDNVLTPEQHLEIMDSYDEALAKKYPVLAKASGRDFEPPVKSTLVAAVEAFMKDTAIQPAQEAEPASEDDDDLIDDETDDRLTGMIGRDLELVDLKSKSAQDQAAKEAIRRELFRMHVGSEKYYQGLIDILMKPESAGDKKLQKALDVAITDFAEEDAPPKSPQDYFVFIAYMNQDLRPDEKKNYRNTVLNRAAEHMMSQADFAGAKGRADRPHINKDSTLANLMAAVDGIKSRGDKDDADRLEKLSDVLDKMLPKGKSVPVINIRDEEPEEEAEEKPQVTRSPGGKTFRRRRGETEMAESMTPADAILQSSAVSPDLDRALRLVKGIS